MDTNKLIGIILMGGVLGVCSCNSCEDNKDYNPSVSREVYDDLQQKYDMLKESVEGTISANEETRLEINRIMVELNTITGKTVSLQKNVENGTAGDVRSTAEQISESLADIKRRLKAVPTQKADQQTLALVNNLQQTIALNEQEIKRLNGVIEEKNQTISNLDNELSDVNEQLQLTLDEMKRAEMASWISMGDELLSTAELLPNVKGHGNMKEIKKAKLTILLRAKSAYNQAYKLGNAEAFSKIQIAEKRYQEANDR